MFNNISEEEESEITPDILFARIRVLEDDLVNSKLTKDSMNELLDLYTVRAFLISNFNSYIRLQQNSTKRTTFLKILILSFVK